MRLQAAAKLLMWRAWGPDGRWVCDAPERPSALAVGRELLPTHAARRKGARFGHAMSPSHEAGELVLNAVEHG
eukprot:607414-Alexandrium_andersonii.AAC.1